MNTPKKQYEMPRVELCEVIVEQGFLLSDNNSIDDMEPGDDWSAAE